MPKLLGLERMKGRLAQAPLERQQGRITQAVGQVLEADLPGVSVGTLAEVAGVWAEVIGFQEHRTLLMPLGTPERVAQGTPVKVLSAQLTIRVGEGMLGRVLDPMGEPLDGRPLEDVPHACTLDAPAPDPLRRHRIDNPLPTGVRAIDGMLTLGRGQRVCVMAGSGVGKSTLLGMIARHARADINVIALIGERGREVREFLERDLGPEGLARSVVVVATSDSSPIMQVKGVFAAMSIAEHFRAQGKSVLMLADSLTRLAMAQRQIGLAAGEPPTTKGYTPSVFSLIPSLLERAGPGAGRGSITGVFTVLVEGDDIHDPVADMVRGVVDGHIVLSRRLASHGHYPAIDVLQSLSRTMPHTTSLEQQAAAVRVRDLMATWHENEELVRLGAYRKGTDPAVDRAIQLKPAIDAFLKQRVDEAQPFDQVVAQLQRFNVSST
jgi:flagellum-specific ATP synthase